MSSEGYHEPLSQLSERTIELHRAIRSLMEEFDAVDWYQQRFDATGDLTLKRILLHNRSEELEHACMVLEWLRRHDPVLDQKMRKYLFSEGDITMLEKSNSRANGFGYEPVSASPLRIS